MILSEKQRGITARQLQKFRDALNKIQSSPSKEEWLFDVNRGTLESEISKLENDILEYDMLKSGEVKFSKTYTLESLPKILIQARIASGMSQTQLAILLNLKPQQIQRYEASEYQTASLARLLDIANVLDVHFEGSFGEASGTSTNLFTWASVDEIEWRRFPVEEMTERGWIGSSPTDDEFQAVREYVERTGGPNLINTLHRKKVRSSVLPNEYSLLAWQIRVLDLAQQRIATENFPIFRLDDRWVGELATLTRSNGGPKKALELLKSKGVILVIEKNLSGISLDGAAMLELNGRPVIGLTLRQDRLDSFWFVLMHELGHVFLHLMDGSHYDFFDDDSNTSQDRIETEADEFALNSLIPEKSWMRCAVHRHCTEDVVRTEAKNLGVHESIVAGRIRRERNNYSLLDSLVGQSVVRSQFD